MTIAVIEMIKYVNGIQCHGFRVRNPGVNQRRLFRSTASPVNRRHASAIDHYHRVALCGVPRPLLLSHEYSREYNDDEQRVGILESRENIPLNESADEEAVSDGKDHH